jgi:NADH-quinone oxidoreductase subunit M
MFGESRRAAVLGATGMILGACYLLWMLRKVVFGPLREPPAHGHEAGIPHTAEAHHAAVQPVGWYEMAGLVPLMVLIVLIGAVPGPFLTRIRPAVAVIDDNLQRQRALQITVAPVQPSMRPGSISAPKGGGGASKKSTKGSR